MRCARNSRTRGAHECWARPEYGASVIAKSLDRVDSGSPAGRDVSGGKRGGGNQQHTAGEDREIENPHKDYPGSKQAEKAESHRHSQADADRCVVRGQFNEFEMPGEDPSVFPDIPDFTEDRYHELSAGVLREMIRRTLFSAAAAEHARFGATTGVLWELEDGKARLVATDGRRLALAEGPATAHGGHSTKGQMPVVPAKAPRTASWPQRYASSLSVLEAKCTALRWQVSSLL